LVYYFDLLFLDHFDDRQMMRHMDQNMNSSRMNHMMNHSTFRCIHILGVSHMVHNLELLL